MSDNCYFVTGGTGCVGAWVARNLVQRDIPVVVLNFDNDFHRLELILSKEELASVSFEKGDITSYNDIKNIVEKYKVSQIIHLAALQLPFCRANPPLGAAIDIVGTMNIFEVAKQAGLKRVAYASSAAVYGPKELYPDEPLTHDAAHLPSSHYGVFKVANEWNAKVYWQDDGLSSLGLRPHVVYGPGRDQGMTSTPTVGMLAAAAGLPYKISFSGRYGFQYADDVAKLFIKATEIPFEGAEVFNIGGNTPSTADIVAAIEKVNPESNGKISYEDVVLPFPEEFENVELIKLFGGYPEKSLEEGVRESIGIFRRGIDKGLIGEKELSVISNNNNSSNVKDADI